MVATTAISSAFSLPVAYIGPGAGFAVVGSFLILFAALALALLSLLALPVRLVANLFRKRAKGRFRKVAVLGLDGLDPRRAARLMDAGMLPNLARLRDTGHFGPLQSTCPPISPVAWSTFATGVNPGKHAIYDFLSRDPATYLPILSSARIGTTSRGKPDVRLLRRSRTFWSLLGERGVSCAALRVPISFPPEPFPGLALSAMCTPDLRGTQGEFTCFQAEPVSQTTGGLRIQIDASSQKIALPLPGPSDSKPVTLYLLPSTSTLVLPDRTSIPLREGEFTPWVSLSFKVGKGLRAQTAKAIARFLPVSLAPETFRLYVTPLNIDPAHPAMPISHPSAFSVYLSKLLGPFATLGLAEDTWALSEGVLDDAAFKTQALDIHAERTAQWLEMLRRTRRGLVTCVFDISDRMQHMFMSPNGTASETASIGGVASASPESSDAELDALYARCDELVGLTLAELGPKDLLIVLSDHGFTSFRRCVHVNAWLRDNGYLAPLDPSAPTEYLRNVDWSKTRAYAFGLSGIFLNLKGREANGIVAQGAEADALRSEIAEKLKQLRDPDTNAPVCRDVYIADSTYSGPYVNQAPDLVVGWYSGYRHSWETAVGRVDGDAVVADNPKHWRGDHCVDRREVPGSLFASRPLDFGGRPPHIMDVAPTMLSLWNIPAPGYMDGEKWTIR